MNQLNLTKPSAEYFQNLNSSNLQSLRSVQNELIDWYLDEGIGPLYLLQGELPSSR